MATARQVVANRRNTGRSTGPRSEAGKRRASRNSYRHGLTAAVRSSAKCGERVERLAREIAGGSSDVIILDHAHTAADAQFDLAQIRTVKVGIIERILAFGEAKTPQTSLGEIKRLFRGLDRGEMVLPENDAAPAMPEQEPERSAEAVLRALPELMKLERYERRAAGQRDRALRAIIGRIA